MGRPNRDLLDRFSIAHILAGMFMGVLNFPVLLMLGVGVGWELIEYPLKKNFPNAFPVPTQDTFPHSVVDVFVVVLGWLIGIMIFVAIFLN
jgi:hypothetical protein